MTQVPPRRKLVVYVDGFNLYYGLLKANPQLRWLNLRRMIEKMYSRDEIVHIKYFTARVDDDGRTTHSDKRVRQNTYCSALQNTGVVVIDGRLEYRDKQCNASHCTLETPRYFRAPVEKMTDVNIALHLVDDAATLNPDVFVVISGDTDLIPALQRITQMGARTGNKVLKRVHIPCSAEAFKNRRVDEFGLNCWITNRLTEENVSAALFPEQIQEAGAVLTKPASWN